MTALSVNLNAVAQLRNRRDLPWPSVTGIARIALDAGAAGITVHPRPDGRHIRRADVHDLAELIAAEYPHAEFNVEGYPTDEFLELATSVSLHQVTLVPDDPQQATSDHGWDFRGKANFLADIVRGLQADGRRVSLFCDPDAGPDDISAARDTGAARIELFTGPYGGCIEDEDAAAHELEAMRRTVDDALAKGLAVNAGHDLTLGNLPAFKTVLPEIAEVSIGHGLTADALILGFGEAVRQYRAILETD
ncbi:pyridoxine 5'-phosphate synthase [Devosia pacifica]|uniref:Pyridoxine 5'-phosphate synthase n=1 Tax=Devosia pacifica TaxID=1335967 RepID=A0A918RXS9_9HYPH|nr:pyridoxine 5'-phosphate synthase [Devosia pacifica]GHA15655.1 pyridoxine 5'-phosphate synthase [Devosia pacifica]